jgi:phycocyanobilin:ferredoxin oxidoreductase
MSVGRADLVGSPFHFARVVAEVEEVLVRELGLVPWPLDPDLARAEGTWKGQPAVIETRAYHGRGVRYARFVQMSGAGLEIGNALCLADPVTPLPILGGDLVALGRETGLVVADLSPTLPPGPGRTAQLAPLAAVRARRAPLPPGGALPAWCSAWFSSHALYTRVRPEQAPAAVDAFRDIVSAFVEIARAATPRVAVMTAVAAAQEGYAAAHRSDDKGLRLLAHTFGAAWAERYVHAALFPSLDPRALGWEIALSCDAAGRVTWVDERTGVLLDARPGRRFVELVLPEQAEKASRFLREARAGAADGWELSVLLCGRPATLLFCGVPRAGGALLVGSLLPELHHVAGARVAGIASELATLHREAERQRRALAGSQAGLRAALAREHAARAEAERLAAERAAVLGQIAEGVIIADAAGRITFVNEAAGRLHGSVELGVPIPRYTEAYHLLTPDGLPYPPEELPLAQAVTRGDTVVDAEWRVRRPDGSEVFVQGSAAPVVAADGTRLGAVLAMRDVTAQRLLERQKEEFLATVAHDLKNPLTALGGFVQLLQGRAQRGAPLAPDRVVEMTEQMEASTDKMAAMLDELLDLTHLQMGRPLELRRRPTDLVALAREAVTAQQGRTVRHRIRVETRVDRLVGVWDPSRLGRVLDNLLENAIKYSPAGGDVVVRIDQTASADEAWAHIDVVDQGLGIPPADLPHVFERFHRGANVVGRILGTGIGLAGVHHIVAQHGGTVTVESREGVGSAFSVRLPLTERASDHATGGSTGG